MKFVVGYYECLARWNYSGAIVVSVLHDYPYRRADWYIRTLGLDGVE